MNIMIWNLPYEGNMGTILVTNDDGVYAPGVRALFQALKMVGRPIMIAPERDNSAVSHSLTMSRPLRVRELEVDIFAIDGTPTDCVMLGVAKILPEKPVLIVSGINRGGNLGDDIGYSGTVSAAIEGTMLGVYSMAVSLAGEDPFRFEMAAEIAAQLAAEVLARGLPKDTLLNINIPNNLGEKPEFRFTRQGKRMYDNAIKEIFDPWGRKHYWIGGGTPVWDRVVHTDSQEVDAGHISITPIHLDLTNHAALEDLRAQWQLNDRADVS